MKLRREKFKLQIELESEKQDLSEPQCGNAIYAPIGLFRGARNEGLVFASSCAVLNKYQLCGGKFCFFRRRKSFTVKENHFKNLRRLCKSYRRKLHVPCHSNKVRRN